MSEKWKKVVRIVRNRYEAGKSFYTDLTEQSLPSQPGHKKCRRQRTNEKGSCQFWPSLWCWRTVSYTLKCAPPVTNPSSFRPTLDEIRSWGKSFDRLMRSPGGRKIFRDFLRCEYSEENILFWLACEELKKQTNPEAIEEKARFIYEDYISILSPKEVSLDSRVREIVNRNMVEPTPHTFDEAQLQIYTLMHRDSYPRCVQGSWLCWCYLWLTSCWLVLPGLSTRPCSKL